MPSQPVRLYQGDKIQQAHLNIYISPNYNWANAGTPKTLYTAWIQRWQEDAYIYKHIPYSLLQIHSLTRCEAYIHISQAETQELHHPVVTTNMVTYFIPQASTENCVNQT